MYPLFSPPPFFSPVFLLGFPFPFLWFWCFSCEEERNRSGRKFYQYTLSLKKTAPRQALDKHFLPLPIGAGTKNLGAATTLSPPRCVFATPHWPIFGASVPSASRRFIWLCQPILRMTDSPSPYCYKCLILHAHPSFSPALCYSFRFSHPCFLRLFLHQCPPVSVSFFTNAHPCLFLFPQVPTPVFLSQMPTPACFFPHKCPPLF